MSLVRAVTMSAALLTAAQAAAAQSQPTRFTIRVENISRGEALKLSDGTAAPFVSAPVLWAVHGGANPLFIGGQPDAGKGLETLAETGNPGPLLKSVNGGKDIASAGAVDLPVGASTHGPITPGQGYEFEVTAVPGQSLSVAWMFGQSNDLFYANDRPIALYDGAGKPVRGDMTSQLSLWDAGTEVNEEPGLGPNQGPRQQTPDAGMPEHNAVAHVSDRYSYPRIADVLRVSIAPVEGRESRVASQEP